MKGVPELVAEHQDWIRRKAREFTKARDEAEDLASDTILACLLRQSAYNPKRDFKCWAFVIMRNIHIDRVRHRCCLDFLPLIGYDTVADEHADTRLVFSSHLSRLRELRRKSVCIDFVLLYAMGYTPKEIAGAFSVPYFTVTRRICDGRRMIAKALNVYKS